MSFNIDPTATGDAVTRVSPALGPAPPADPGPAVVVDTIPSSPPPEALDMVEAAARRWRELHDQNRELRFQNDDGGRLRIEVRDLDGNVLCRIPATEAVAVATGEPLGV